MAAKKHGIKRSRISTFQEGGWQKPIKSSLQKQDVHQWWKSGQTGGKPAFQDMMGIGGELGNISPDPIKYIKQFDPSNSSGSVPDAMNIMEKLKSATNGSDLLSSVQPLGNILGSDLYSKMRKAGNQAKSKNKLEEKQNTDIIKKLIQAAFDTLSHDKEEEAIDLLNQNEIQIISNAYYNNQLYSSQRELPEFVFEINKLMPVFRRIYG